jgi:uncharacterized protein (TIGR04255 family)
LADTESRSYPRAPITEAVIEIRVSAEATTREQDKIVRRLKHDYPNAEPLQTFSVSIDTTGGRVGVEEHPRGFRLSTDEQTDVVLVMPQGIATARLAPYPGWQALRDRAKMVWEVWCRSTPHHPISRLGIRYINRIDIPTDERPTVRLQDYLLLHPQFPPLSPGPVFGYIMLL